VGGAAVALRGERFSFSLPVGTVHETWSMGLSRLLG
jgi:hypothetical protein